MRPDPHATPSGLPAHAVPASIAGVLVSAPASRPWLLPPHAAKRSAKAREIGRRIDIREYHESESDPPLSAPPLEAPELATIASTAARALSRQPSKSSPRGPTQSAASATPATPVASAAGRPARP